MKVVALTAVILSIALMISIPLIPGFMISRLLNGVSLEDPAYFLVVGRDRTIEGTTRADVIMVVGVDFRNRRSVILSVPRDLEYGGRRINSLFNDGIDALKVAVENITGVKIWRYAVFDYESFKTLGDELGPIRVTVRQPMNYVDEVQNLRINFLPGVHELSGEELLAYIRYRKGGMGDLDRLRRQKEVFHEIVRRALSTDISKLLKIYSKLLESIETDISMGEFAMMALKLRRGLSFSFLQLPVKPTESGMVEIAMSKIDGIRRALAEVKVVQEERKYRIILFNAKKNKSRYFWPIEEKRWLLSVGFKPSEIVWEDTGVVMDGSILLVCTKNSKAKKELEEIVKRVYPHRDFTVRWTAYLDGADLYYHLKESALKIRKFLEEADALVVLGEVSRR